MAVVTARAVESPRTREKIVANPADGTSHELFKVTGPGLFLALRVAMSATNGNFTSVTLIIDGNTVINDKYSAYITFGQTTANPFGAMVTKASESNSKALYFGMPYPLAFKQELTVSVTIGGAGVQQIHGELMTGQ